MLFIFRGRRSTIFSYSRFWAFWAHLRAFVPFPVQFIKVFYTFLIIKSVVISRLFNLFSVHYFLIFSDYLNALFKAELIAFLFVSSLGCTYISNVVLTSLCPNIEETVFTSTLLSISVEANVWRSP